MSFRMTEFLLFPALIEICKLALEYLKDGPITDKYCALGQRLEKPQEFIQKVIESMVFFLIECLRLQVHSPLSN